MELPFCMLSTSSKGLLSAHDKLDAMIKALSNLTMSVNGLTECSEAVSRLGDAISSVQRLDQLEAIETRYNELVTTLESLGLTAEDLADMTKLRDALQSQGDGGANQPTTCGYSAQQIAELRSKIEALLAFFNLTV